MVDQSGNGKVGKKGPSGRSYRNATGLTRQPKKMRGRKVSSQRWLTRQLNDPFVAEAKSRGFRSRAALKLEQMDDRYHLLQPGMAIVDLGSADTTGHRATDHLRTTALLEAALDFAIDVLNKDGFFLAKCFRGGAERSLLDVMQRNFKTVRHVKPAASRAESVESYVLATGFHGSGHAEDIAADIAAGRRDADGALIM